MFTTSDPLNRTVTLKTETWNNKIANISGENINKIHGNSHEDMVDFLDEIQKTIEAPHYILNDLEVSGVDSEGKEILSPSKTREEYFRIFINNEKACLNSIKTIVEFNDEHTHGEIVTSHRMNGKLSRISTKGGVVYDSNNK